MPQLTTGLKRRPENIHAKFCAERPFTADKSAIAKAASNPQLVIQTIGFIRNQWNKPSCVGQAIHAGLDARFAPVFGSAIDTWIDARRRQGSLAFAEEGTESRYAIDSIAERGVSLYVKGQDSHDSALDTEMPELADEVQAANRVMVIVKHTTLTGLRTPQLITALSLNQICVFGAGCSDKYFAPPHDVVLDPSYLGSSGAGHEQRVFAYFPSLRAFGVQNSWGDGTESAPWCEFTYAGVVYKGCTLVSPAVIEQVWDVDCIDVSLKLPEAA